MVLIDIRNLSVRYTSDEERVVHAVEDVSFDIGEGEIFGLVGESGSGKTTIGRAIIRLLGSHGSIEQGEVRFDGRDLTTLADTEIRDVRWAEISMIPQGSMSGLNPVYKVGDQIVEAILHHDRTVTEAEARQRTHDLLDRVGVDPDRARDYAHELSGGMKQRVMIAMALACDPALIIADEPTTALDVVVQDQVLAEFEAIREDLDVSLLLISHDISVVSETCDRVGVLYGGKLMEVGPTEEVFGSPANPYTLGLKHSFPDVSTAQEELVSIPGTAPDLHEPPTACRFIDRCPFATEECKRDHPPLFDVSPGHGSACYHLDSLAQMRAEAAKERTWR